MMGVNTKFMIWGWSVTRHKKMGVVIIDDIRVTSRPRCGVVGSDATTTLLWGWLHGRPRNHAPVTISSTCQPHRGMRVDVQTTLNNMVAEHCHVVVEDTKPSVCATNGCRVYSLWCGRQVVIQALS